jgi:hypothetical protein
MKPIEIYLRELRDIRSTGAAVKETSYYPALANLLNEVGGKLKPKVRCVINLKNQGAGMPDGGLFTPDQLKRGSDEPPPGQLPARGAIECKSTRDDAWITADTNQVTRYWDKYRQVLVTNYRDFVLIGTDESTRQPLVLETFRLAANEKTFWQAAAHPATLAAALGERFLEYLRRVMLHAAPLADPKDVAWFLASYARDAKARLAAALPALDTIKSAMEEALGVRFEGERGQHFFLSTLVQTLFYGVFSAWVLWHRSAPRPGAAFDWEKAANYLHMPILRKLFREMADRTQLQDWNLAEVLDWTATVLNRVDRTSFFAKFQDAEAVQYFYEPFLEAFDPDLRKQLGVWYTPPEVVRYMVARVDTVLREVLDRPDGLADPDVYILDPCCGTGAYLVEVLRSIAATLKDKGADALLGSQLKDAATKRLFGFELLPAPFVVAHLQLGLFLQSEGVPLDDKKKERAGVYLTNALTGWQPPKTPKHYLFPEMEEEHDKAEAVKLHTPILVVIGNPPYNGFAGVAVEEERELSDAYRTPIGDLKPQGQGLNDLYIRFFRMAERCIVERQQKQGVVCFISNYSWLDGLSFPVMRQRFLSEFGHIWIDSLNGDKYKTGKETPDGLPDPSVFSTDHNREGIQVGTAIALLVRKAPAPESSLVRFRDIWGVAKRADLVASLAIMGSKLYEQLEPPHALGLPLRPLRTDTNYLTFPLVPDLFPVWFTGVKTSRDDVVVDIDRDELVKRMNAYFDPKISHEEMTQISPRAMSDAARFQAVSTRETLVKRGFLPDNVVPFAYRPFDLRWLYWEPITKLLDEKRPEYFPHVFTPNHWLVAAQQNRKHFDPPSIVRRHASIHIIERSANLFPLLLQAPNHGDRLFDEGTASRKLGHHYVNLSDKALGFLADRGGVAAASNLFHHAAAILHAPSYIAENGGALRQDWPRVPLPFGVEQLDASAGLGEQVALLLDAEAAVAGVTAGKLRPELKVIGIVSRSGGGQLNLGTGELDVTARWGIAGKGGICMPSTGRLQERDYTKEELTAIGKGAAELGMDEATALACLGARTLDIYLNDVAYWHDVPTRVWQYTLGGYQVMKKWLSYREKALLGRGLTLAEVTEVTNMARRIAALLLLQPALDANYQAVKEATYPWPGSAKLPEPS